MEIKTIEIPYAETIRLVPFGDWHVANINCAKDKIDEYVEWISKAENTFWIGMGDYGDCIAPLMNEPRYFTQTIDPEFLNDPSKTAIDAQWGWIEERIEKVKDKCLGLHIGNHEYDYLQKTHGHDFVREICSKHNLNYLGYTALIRVKIMNGQKKEMEFVICSTHGSTGARKAGTKLNFVESWVPNFEADIYLVGHTHTALAYRNIIQWTDGTNLFDAKKVYCLTGSFLRGYKLGTTSYVERKNLSAIKIGLVKISIYPREKELDIHAEA